MKTRERKMIILYDQACQARAEGNLGLALQIEARIQRLKKEVVAQKQMR